LCHSQRKIFDVYEEIRETKDWQKLVEMVSSGVITPYTVDKHGQTPLMQAVDMQLPLHTLRSLVELGCDLNAQNSEGETALHQAMICEFWDAFSELIAMGADPSIADNQGESVLSESEVND
jgi:uncharacterized protein